jgi:N6-L-threonylcarbamoyladenine synthase
MPIKILGIETSCDETAAAVVTDTKQILSNVIYSQFDEHKAYGGVVPEIASRAHITNINRVVLQAMSDAGIEFKDLDAIAVTAGPGLIGGVIVGLMTAKAIASATNKPLIGVNHLEGHALTCRLTDDVKFPFLLLLVSGGHCQILEVKNVGEYKLLGKTLDDSVGEAFDKVAKMLGLGYPGGPIIEKLALQGDENRFTLPLSMVGREGFDFSFSGLKTAVFRLIDSIENRTEKDVADICASFQKTVAEILIDRVTKSIQQFRHDHPQANSFVISGGVAANKYIGGKLKAKVEAHGLKFYAPPLKLCTDNAVMIAHAGIERFKLGMIDDLKLNPKSRWPLDDSSIAA